MYLAMKPKVRKEGWGRRESRPPARCVSRGCVDAIAESNAIHADVQAACASFSAARDFLGGSCAEVRDACRSSPRTASVPNHPTHHKIPRDKYRPDRRAHVAPFFRRSRAFTTGCWLHSRPAASRFGIWAVGLRQSWRRSLWHSHPDWMPADTFTAAGWSRVWMRTSRFRCCYASPHPPPPPIPLPPSAPPPHRH